MIFYDTVSRSLYQKRYHLLFIGTGSFLEGECGCESSDFTVIYYSFLVGTAFPTGSTVENEFSIHVE